MQTYSRVMRTIKSVEYQTDEDCKRFEENTIELNKALHLLIDDPLIPGSDLKHSNQLKGHLLFDGHALDFMRELEEDTWRRR